MPSAGLMRDVPGTVRRSWCPRICGLLCGASLPALLAASALGDPAVASHRGDSRAADVDWTRSSFHVRYGEPFTPDDPYFPRDTPSAPWPGQWYLVNSQTPGRDARVQAAWSAGWTGAGVTIGIVDDGLQNTHPDLAPNYSAAASWDFAANSADPSGTASDWHGTSVAGVAAARGGNGIGVTGAAPLASLAGLRIDFANQTDAMFVDATLFKSSGADRSIAIKNHSYGIALPYMPNQAQAAALTPSAAAGTIHVFAAGNERVRTTNDQFDIRFYYNGDANKKQTQASPDVITVAAFGSDGTWSNSSNYGANIFVTAPSSSSKGIGGATGVTTTDRVGADGYNTAFDSFPDSDYASVFGGTSAAAPLVAGVLALAKEAQPALDGRFAKHLLARTSDVVDPNDATVFGGGDGATPGSAWKTNAAGHSFNMNYGFGLIDASELVTESQAYSGVTPLETLATGSLNVAQTINDLAGVTRTAEIAAATRLLEEVLVTLDISHAYPHDLEAYLTSPSNTVSRLMLSSLIDTAYDNLAWTFTTNAFWGESATGTWSLQVIDTYPELDDGTWNSWSMTLRTGELVAVPEPASLILAAAAAGLFPLLRHGLPTRRS
jgi:subtilisin-like proprotein convertase family protein